MTNLTRVTVGVPYLMQALFAAICILAAGPAAQARETILREEDINEETITNALLPHDAADRTETLGITRRDIPATGEVAGPATSDIASLLLTFNTNSSKLSKSSCATLDKVARSLRSATFSPYKFRIVGHADPRGSASANLKLSENRAAAVVKYLNREGGIAADRLTAVGKGSTEPWDLKNPAAPENRRVSIVPVQP